MHIRQLNKSASQDEMNGNRTEEPRNEECLTDICITDTCDCPPDGTCVSTVSSGCDPILK